MSGYRFIESSELEKTVKKAKIKGWDSLYQRFKDWKAKSPNMPMDGLTSKDSPLKGGALKSIGLWHLDIGREFRLFYVPVYDKKVIYVQGIYTHEETGTGTPAKQPKQTAFANKIANGMRSNSLVERIDDFLSEATAL